jgi:hypothetical protein
LQALADDKDKSGGGGKAAAKENFNRVFNLMVEDEDVKPVVPSLPWLKLSHAEMREEFGKGKLQEFLLSVWMRLERKGKDNFQLVES